MKGNQQPPFHVPVLTEVVVMPEERPEDRPEEEASSAESADAANASYASSLPDVTELPSLTDEVDLATLTDAYAITAPAGLDDLPPNSSAVQTPEAQAMQAAQAAVVSAAAAQPLALPPALDENLLTQRVLADLSRQLDLMFEQRLRESMTPMLTRLTDTLMREMRSQVATSLREMVTRAVSLELDKIQKRRQG